MPSPLLALALGALTGAQNNREQAKADAAEKRRQQQQDLATELQLRTMPGVSIEDANNNQYRSMLDIAGGIANGETTGGIGGAPGGGKAPVGADVGTLTLGGTQQRVRYDDAQSPAHVATTNRNRQVVQWQQVTNPRSTQPFSQAEAELLADGKAKYGDFKPDPEHNIDPLSPEGVTASGKRAGVEAKAKQPFAQAPTQIVTDKDGNLIVVNKRDASTQGTGVVAAPKASGNARSTQQQRQVASAIPQVQTSAKLIDQFNDMKLLNAMSQKAGPLGNYTTTPEGQQLQQAATQFITMSAYALSGKTVTASEVQRLWDTFIPRPGDSQAVLQQKSRARQQQIEAMRTAAGQGAPGTGAPAAGAPGTDQRQGSPIVIGGKTFLLPQ